MSNAPPASGRLHHWQNSTWLRRLRGLVAQPGAAPHFPSLGEFLQAVVRSYRPGAGLDAQMAAYVKALGLNVGAPSEGGYLVEPTYANALLERVYHTGDLLPRCNREHKLDPESTSTQIPYIEVNYYRKSAPLAMMIIMAILAAAGLVLMVQYYMSIKKLRAARLETEKEEK